MRKAKGLLESFDEARVSVFHESRKFLMDGEGCPLDDCAGRILAEPISAPHDLPLADNSSMDGFCLRCSDVGSASPETPIVLPISSHIDAGTPPGFLEPRKAAYIATGGLLPEGANAVLKLEDSIVSRDGKHLTVTRPLPSGSFVRPRGRDARAGTPVLEPGTRLTTFELGLLASFGRVAVRVSRKPRVALVTSGNELLMPFENPQPWQIRNSNSTILSSQIIEAGGNPIDLGIVRDDIGNALESLEKAASLGDIIVTSGGISMGRKDPFIAALHQAKSRTLVSGVAMKPGKPFYFGFFKGVPIFGLPGNPASSAVTFELFVRPFLGRILRRLDPDRNSIHLPLSATTANPSPRDIFFRARIRSIDGRTVAEVLEKQESHMLSSLLGADLLIRHRAGEPYLRKGRTVECILLREPL